MRRVVGASMQPALMPGRIVLLLRPMRISPGDIVVFWHDGREKIKRIAEISEGKLYVVGDNPAASTDSRHFGWVPYDTVIARVVLFNRRRPAE